jgi:FixJ family two-component response regulator
MHDTQQPDLTLYIVDDDEAARKSLVTLFAAVGYRVQAFACGEDFLAGAAMHIPHCVLLDQRMQGMTGLQVHEELLRQASPMVVIFLSGHGDIPMAIQATHKGAYDWLVKGMPEDEIAARVKVAMQHAMALAVQHQADTEVAGRWATLTPREKDVARLLRQGWASKLVADELTLSVRTVDFYRAQVFDKLWVSNPTELDRLMREHRVE